MKATFPKESKEFQIFGDFYALIKEYYIPEESKGWYAEWLNAVDKFFAKYGVDKAKKLKQKDRATLLAYVLGYAAVDYIDNSVYIPAEKP